MCGICCIVNFSNHISGGGRALGSDCIMDCIMDCIVDCIMECRPDAPGCMGSVFRILSGSDMMTCMVIFHRCVDFHSMNDANTLDESESYPYAKLQSVKPACTRR